MTNYEKLISSIILSAVLSKTYGLGCGCNCGNDDDDDEISIIQETQLNNRKKGSKKAKTTNKKYKEEIIYSQYNYEKDNEENNISSTFFNNYGAFINNIINKKTKTELLQLFTIESQILGSENIENEQNLSETIKDIKNQNTQIILKLYTNFQEEYQNTVDITFTYDFYEENKEQIEKLDYSLQLIIASLLIDLINSISQENQTIELFSKACLYHNLKKAYKKNKNIPKDFVIQKKSPIRLIIQNLRDQIFLSLFKYTTEYLNLCYLKFGEGFWIQKKENQLSLSRFFGDGSDENKTIKALFGSAKTFGSYNLYENICDMPFSKIKSIKEKLNTLPNFSEIFEKDNKTYKVKEEKIGNFKTYFNFLDEDNTTLLEHEKDINKFFDALSKQYKKNETNDEAIPNISFTFKGLEAPEIKLAENTQNEEKEK